MIPPKITKTGRPVGRPRKWTRLKPKLMISFRVTSKQKAALRLRCAELDMTIQEFVRRLLKLEGVE